MGTSQHGNIFLTIIFLKSVKQRIVTNSCEIIDKRKMLILWILVKE